MQEHELEVFIRRRSSRDIEHGVAQRLELLALMGTERDLAGVQERRGKGGILRQPFRSYLRFPLAQLVEVTPYILQPLGLTLPNLRGNDAAQPPSATPPPQPH